MIKLIVYPRRHISVEIGQKIYYKDNYYRVVESEKEFLKIELWEKINEEDHHFIYFNLNDMDAYTKKGPPDQENNCNSILSETLDFLGINIDVERILNDDKITYISDLIEKTASYLKKELGLKARQIMELKEVLEENGLCLADS